MFFSIFLTYVSVRSASSNAFCRSVSLGSLYTICVDIARTTELRSSAVHICTIRQAHSCFYRTLSTRTHSVDNREQIRDGCLDHIARRYRRARLGHHLACTRCSWALVATHAFVYTHSRAKRGVECDIALYPAAAEVVWVKLARTVIGQAARQTKPPFQHVADDPHLCTLCMCSYTWSWHGVVRA